MGKWCLRLGSLAGFLFFFALGLNLAFNSWQGSVYVSGQEFVDGRRDVASVAKTLGFTYVRGDLLRQNGKLQSIAQARVLETQKALGVGLGHFLVKTQSGKKAFICRQHESVELTFQAEGIAVNGEKPQMKVKGRCLVTNDVNSISTLWIPVEDIVKKAYGDIRLASVDRGPVLVQFNGVGSSWPRTWVLSQVRFYSLSSKNPPVIVNQQEISSLKRDQRLSLDWSRWLQ